MVLHTDQSMHNNWESTDPEVMREWQVNRLRRYLRQTVLPFSAYYGELGIEPDEIRTLDDLKHIPFTSKKDLLPTDDHPNRPRDFVLIPDQEVLKRRPDVIARAILSGRKRLEAELDREYRPILMTSTTGRSTEPVPFLYTAYDLENLRTTGLRLMEICDSKKDFRHLNMFPYAPHLAFWQAHYACLGMNAFMLSTGGGKVMGTSGNVAMAKKIKPEAVIGMPTFVYHVLQECVAEGVRWSNLSRIVLGGEKVPEGMRRKLRSLCAEVGATDVEIMATYAFTEAKSAWPECPVSPGEPSSGYHLYPDLGILEVVDPETGDPVGEGEPGEIVYTPLDARGSVVLRYRTGDEISGGLTYEKCPHCGRVVPRLIGRISRVSEYRELKLDKIKGTLVNFNELEHVLDEIEEIGAWQIEIRKIKDDPLGPDELIVHVHAKVPTRRRNERRALSDAIRRRIQLSAEIAPNRVEFHSASEMRRLHGVGKNLKEEKVVDHRPPAGVVSDEELGSSSPVRETVHAG